MSADVDLIHHLGIVTNDFEALIETYEGLGFVLTPQSVPRIPLRPGGAPEPLGVGNSCAIFRDNYLELLGVVDRERWASIGPEQRGPFDIDRVLHRYEGIHILHFGSDDLEHARDRFERQDLNPSPIRPFQRPVDTAVGIRTMHARSVSFPAGLMPEALVQVAQHDTPELVLQPRYMNHPNGAQRISEVIICAEAPDVVASRYECPSRTGAQRVCGGFRPRARISDRT